MRLRRSRVSSPGIERRRRGTGFSFTHADGKIVDDDDLDRIRALVIPPAWSDVWISPDPLGHIQAVGVDAAGRKQYLYHPEWRTRRDLGKFERMARFGQRLPSSRRTVTRHLGGPENVRLTVMACAFRLLDDTLIRIGGEQYARSSGALGLATLRSSCCELAGDAVVLTFPGKSGIRHELEVHDPAVRRVVAALKQPRGGRRRDPELFAWKDDDGWHDVRSVDINDYVHRVVGDEFTAKDFRTWHATVTVAQVLLDVGPPQSPTAGRRAVREAIQTAATRLGNTPSVARSSYVDPRVVEAYLDGRLTDPTGRRSGERVVRELMS